jgi:hypothetical protein
MGFITEHSAVNCTAEHYKPLFWRRLATKPSPLVVPQLCPQLAFLNILSLDSLQDNELLFFRCASFLQKDFPGLKRTMPNWITSASPTIHLAWFAKRRKRADDSHRAFTTCAVSSWESEELDEPPHALFLAAPRKSLGS